MLASKYQDYMFGLLKRVIDEIGPRPSCSEAEKKLGRLLVDEWKPACDEVRVEPFTCSPIAYYCSFYILALLGFATVILYWFLPPLALALATIGCSIMFLEIVRYREFVDFLFPRKQGENVIGAFRPKGEPAQRVIVSADMDSGPEFTIFLYLKSAAILLIAVALLGQVLTFGGSLAKTIAYFNGLSAEAALNGVGIAMIALTPVAGLFLFFTLWKPVPGAVDDMAGVSVVAGLGRYLSEAKSNGDWFPQRTEVVLLATSSEEAGARGAKRYVSRHLKEMKTTRTYFLNMASIKDERFLTVLKGEPSTGVRHDPELVRIAQEVAASHNWPTIVKQLLPPFATDATPFSLSRIPAICLDLKDSSRWDPIIHTRYDTYEHVRPEALSAALQVVMDMIQRIDQS